jgi:hypothetical protein
MALPCSSQLSRSCNAGGGGCRDHPRQYLRSMIQGSSHARTARSALGQDTSGRTWCASLLFSPRVYLPGSFVRERND